MALFLKGEGIIFGPKYKQFRKFNESGLVRRDLLLLVPLISTEDYVIAVFRHVFDDLVRDGSCGIGLRP